MRQLLRGSQALHRCRVVVVVISVTRFWTSLYTPPTPFISRFASQQMLIEVLLSPGMACHPGASCTKPSRTQTFKFSTGIAGSFTTICKLELNTMHRTQRLQGSLCFLILSRTKAKPFGVFKFKGNGRRFAGEKIQTPPSLGK